MNKSTLVSSVYAIISNDTHIIIKAVVRRGFVGGEESLRATTYSALLKEKEKKISQSSCKILEPQAPYTKCTNSYYSMTLLLSISESSVYV